MKNYKIVIIVIFVLVFGFIGVMEYMKNKKGKEKSSKKETPPGNQNTRPLEQNSNSEAAPK